MKKLVFILIAMLLISSVLATVFHWIGGYSWHESWTIGISGSLAGVTAPLLTDWFYKRFSKKNPPQK